MASAMDSMVWPAASDEATVDRRFDRRVDIVVAAAAEEPALTVEETKSGRVFKKKFCT